MNDYINHKILLEDYKRLYKFLQAIQTCVFSKSNVVDIGAGLGILTYFAYEQNAKIYSIENNRLIHKSKIKLFKHLGINNNRIKHILDNAQNVKIENHVDVVVSELIGPTGLEEDIVDILYEFGAKNQVSKYVPEQIEVYIRPLFISESFINNSVYNFFDTFKIGNYKLDSVASDFLTDLSQRLQLKNFSKNQIERLRELNKIYREDKLLVRKYIIGKNSTKNDFQISYRLPEGCNSIQLYFNAKLTDDIFITSDILNIDSNYHWGYHFFINSIDKYRNVKIKYNYKLKKYNALWS